MEAIKTKVDIKELKSRVNLTKLWKRSRSVTITDYDPTYKVVYLGNVLTGWAKGDGCVDKPLATLWRNYCQSSKPDIHMHVTVCNSGLKAVTKEHGLTEYWSNRVTYCVAHQNYPRVFCWVYRHEGRRMKQELRCHAVLCSKETKAVEMSRRLQEKLVQALTEFKKEKICRQNARLSLANSVYDNPSLPTRKILLSTGSQNYRPPLERSKSAPKLMAIEEIMEEPEQQEEEEEEETEPVNEEEDVHATESVASETTSDVVPDIESLSDGRKDSVGDKDDDSSLGSAGSERDDDHLNFDSQQASIRYDAFIFDDFTKDLAEVSQLPSHFDKMDPCYVSADCLLEDKILLNDQDNVSDESGYSEESPFHNEHIIEESKV